MNHFLNTLNKPVYKHILFWIVVFLFYTTSASDRFDTTEEVIFTYFFHVIFQIIIAYAILNFIVPIYKKNKNLLYVIASLTLLFFFINSLYVSIRMFFLEPAYPSCYKAFFERYGYLTFGQRIFNWKHMFITLPLFYLQPLFFLIALQFYEKQQKISKISEQKKALELKALKNQLNPHFLFNTLNNLYLLTVEKSDKAPEVIEKLSGILDYILYGTDDTFVSLKKEIQLIENYLSLEQIRYEDRVEITFDKKVNGNYKIAPLILLTFIENAFKHGVKNELEIAKVSLSLTTENDHIIFKLSNSKPKLKTITVKKAKKNIGLKNIEHQLNLIYPNSHTLNIKDNDNLYTVTLSLKKN